MKNKNFIVQNLIIFFPFVHLLFINFFQIRKTELIKLLLFASVYLLLFNFVRYFFKKFIYLKNSDYFAVILFYLLFNYSNITIYIYFQAFDFIKFIPNYSFLIFTALLIVFLYISTKINLNKYALTTSTKNCKISSFLQFLSVRRKKWSASKSRLRNGSSIQTS